jgi:hypothetical protein
MATETAEALPVAMARRLRTQFTSTRGNLPRYNNNNNTTDNNTDNQQPQQEESFTSILHQLVGSSPEVASFFSSLEKYIPFVLILAIKQLFDHSTGNLLKRLLNQLILDTNNICLRKCLPSFS